MLECPGGYGELAICCSQLLHLLSPNGDHCPQGKLRRCLQKEIKTAKGTSKQLPTCPNIILVLTTSRGFVANDDKHLSTDESGRFQEGFACVQPRTIRDARTGGFQKALGPCGDSSTEQFRWFKLTLEGEDCQIRKRTLGRIKVPESC
eukprot:761953-Hanusia_phi.AAC.1